MSERSVTGSSSRRHRPAVLRGREGRSASRRSERSGGDPRPLLERPATDRPSPERLAPGLPASRRLSPDRPESERPELGRPEVERSPPERLESARPSARPEEDLSALGRPRAASPAREPSRASLPRREPPPVGRPSPDRPSRGAVPERPSADRAYGLRDSDRDWSEPDRSGRARPERGDSDRGLPDSARPERVGRASEPDGLPPDPGTRRGAGRAAADRSPRADDPRATGFPPADPPETRSVIR